MVKCVKSVAVGVLLALWPAINTWAQINHCIGADGIHIYTDQGCSSFNAYRAEDAPPEFSYSPRPDSEVAEFTLPAHGCARELNDLEQRLRDAIAARDHNELATLFHWSGASRYTADRVMPLLTQISRTPVHDISIVTEHDDLTLVSYPVTLELEQSDTSLPDSYRVTRFRLMESAGCWWMTF